MPQRHVVIGALSILVGIALIVVAVAFRTRLGLTAGVILGVLLMANGVLRLWLHGRQRSDDRG